MTTPYRIIIAEGNKARACRLGERLTAVGHTVTTMRTLQQVVKQVQSQQVDLVIIGPPPRGPVRMATIQAIKQADPRVEIMVVANSYTAEEAVEAIKRGACDFLPASHPHQRIVGKVAELVQNKLLRERVASLEQALQPTLVFHGMVGKNPLMLELFATIRRAAPHPVAVLITGETGTGKEMVAQALHSLSQRKGPFIVCNCSAIPEGLAESELFGHTKGAFTGAIQNKIGLFETAQGGTLFLDEVGDLPVPLQPKLLRVLESGEIQRVGHPHTKQLDIRLLAATNQDLRELVQQGRFRSDLYYRLNVIEVRIPPLRERKDDIPHLCRHFLEQLGRRLGKELRGLSREAQVALVKHNWPGNVRELEHILEAAALNAPGNFIPLQALPPYLQAGNPPPSVVPATLASLEKQQILLALQQMRNNKSGAARLLGLSRRSLYRKLQRHGIPT